MTKTWYNRFHMEFLNHNEGLYPWGGNHFDVYIQMTTNGTIRELMPSDNPLEWEENDDDDVRLAVRGSSGYLSFMYCIDASKTNYMDDLSSFFIGMDGEMSARVVVYRGTGNNKGLIWQGFLGNEVISFPYDAHYNTIKIPILSCLQCFDKVFFPTTTLMTRVNIACIIDKALDAVSYDISTCPLKISNIYSNRAKDLLDKYVLFETVTDIGKDETTGNTQYTGKAFSEILNNLLKYTGICLREDWYVWPSVEKNGCIAVWSIPFVRTEEKPTFAKITADNLSAWASGNTPSLTYNITISDFSITDKLTSRDTDYSSQKLYYANNRSTNNSVSVLPPLKRITLKKDNVSKTSQGLSKVTISWKKAYIEEDYKVLRWIGTPKQDNVWIDGSKSAIKSYQTFNSTNDCSAISKPSACIVVPKMGNASSCIFTMTSDDIVHEGMYLRLKGHFDKPTKGFTVPSTDEYSIPKWLYVKIEVIGYDDAVYEGRIPITSDGKIDGANNPIFGTSYKWLSVRVYSADSSWVINNGKTGRVKVTIKGVNNNDGSNDDWGDNDIALLSDLSIEEFYPEYSGDTVITGNDEVSQVYDLNDYGNETEDETVNSDFTGELTSYRLFRSYPRTILEFDDFVQRFSVLSRPIATKGWGGQKHFFILSRTFCASTDSGKLKLLNYYQ